MKNYNKKEILGIIPARGKSKSIPLKNIVLLNGYPLIAYVIKAGKKCKSIQRIICSTDDERIAEVCKNFGIEVISRPKKLAQDDTHIVDVIIDLIHTLKKNENYLPFAIALLQPTSPFVLPEHIDNCVELLKVNPDANSVQTITTLPHNYHAYNQRVVEKGIVRFRFAKERAICYNKQTKPKFYIFGNFVVTKTKALLEKKEVFAVPSLAYEIPPHYALDVDGLEELELAEWYIQKGKVYLPQMK